MWAPPPHQHCIALLLMPILIGIKAESLKCSPTAVHLIIKYKYTQIENTITPKLKIQIHKNTNSKYTQITNTQKYKIQIHKKYKIEIHKNTKYKYTKVQKIHKNTVPNCNS